MSRLRWGDDARQRPNWPGILFVASFILAMLIGGMCEAQVMAPGGVIDDDLEDIRKARRDAISTGIITMAIGAVGVGVGVAVPFGDEKLTITPSSNGGVTFDYEEKSMNGLNYVLIASGSALVVVGGILIGNAPKVPKLEHSAIMPSAVGGAPGVLAVARW